MVTDNYYNNPDQQVLKIPDTLQKKRKRRTLDTKRLLKQRLNEVIMGIRPVLKVYSGTLKTDLWFVNEGLINPAEQNFPGKMITMAMLAEIMAEGGQFAVGDWQ